MRDALHAFLDRHRFTLAALWWVSFGLVAAGTLAPDAGPPSKHSLDKLAHFTAYAWLTFLAAVGLTPPRARRAFAGILILATLLELAQAAIPMRSASAADALANLAGCVTGYLIGRGLRPSPANTDGR